MTALSEYQRLESPGLWRAAPDEQRREVYVSLGDATLIIYDRASRPLAHWSLPAVVRLNPGLLPALYGPSADAPEELEITDPDMVGAIEKVRSAIERRRPHHGRLRGLILGATLAVVLAVGAWLVPEALVKHTASVLPPVTRAEIGNRLLGHIQRLAGMPCSTPAGDRALARLHARLLPDRAGRLVVLSSGGIDTAHLPGGTILLNRALVEDFDTPDVVAGYVLAEALRAARTDPIEDLLGQAGTIAAARLLTTGKIPDDVLAAHAERLMTRPPAALSDDALIDAMLAARLATAPYAYARDITGESTLALIEANPDAPAPVLTDADWVGLQGICGE